ncbi:hypothetical protein IWZ01DRAFT_253373 [Phyllosticta capitalensis]
MSTKLWCPKVGWCLWERSNRQAAKFKATVVLLSWSIVGSLQAGRTSERGVRGRNLYRWLTGPRRVHSHVKIKKGMPPRTFWAKQARVPQPRMADESLFQQRPQSQCEPSEAKGCTKFFIFLCRSICRSVGGGEETRLNKKQILHAAASSAPEGLERGWSTGEAEAAEYQVPCRRNATQKKSRQQAAPGRAESDADLTVFELARRRQGHIREGVVCRFRCISMSSTIYATARESRDQSRVQEATIIACTHED